MSKVRGNYGTNTAHVALRLPSWVADHYRAYPNGLSDQMRRVLTQYARENGGTEDLTTSTAKVSLPYEQDTREADQGQGGSDPQA